MSGYSNGLSDRDNLMQAAESAVIEAARRREAVRYQPLAELLQQKFPSSGVSQDVLFSKVARIAAANGVALELEN